MLNYGTASEIAAKVLAKLDIPDDIYLTWDRVAEREFEKKYLEIDFIRPLVEAELANYDTSENVPEDIEDIVEGAVDEVFYSLEEYTEKFYQYQDKITLDAYSDIVEALQNAALSNVVDMDVIYEPADTSVGEYSDVRAIEFQLSNGACITLNVLFEEA